jgi:hypothetical protein
MSAILLSACTCLSFGFASLDWIGLDESFQAGQLVLPEGAVLLQPMSDLAERLRIETIKTMAAIALFANQAGLAQQAKVLGNRGTRNREGVRDCTGRLPAAAKKIKNGAARGIGKGAEDAIRRMSNRTVSHNA